VTLPAAYVAEHTHLAYAATGYGVQGVTTTSAHTLLSESLDAAGVYVGMTRGRKTNVLHVVSESVESARDQFVDALQRDRADRGLHAATIDAQAVVAGLTADGPVKVVNEGRARLVDVIAHAEREAARWKHAAELLAAQARKHSGEEAAGQVARATAIAQLTVALDNAVQPLLDQAISDAHVYLDAQEQRHAAWEASRSSGRLGRRAAQRKLDLTQAELQIAHTSLVDRWGSLPPTGKVAVATQDGLDAWAQRVVRDRAHTEPAVSNARKQVEAADQSLAQTRRRHRAEAEDLHFRVYGERGAYGRRISAANNASGRAARWLQHAEVLRADLTRIESLPIGRALHYMETRQAQVEQAAANRAARRHTIGYSTSDIDRKEPGPGLDM
jgi:hypothetical protein